MSEIQSVPVSRLVSNINQKLSRIDLSKFWISGELSNVKNVNGNYYFNLKDDQGQIACTIWKSNAYGLSFALEDGMEVLVRGRISVYVKRGSLQFTVVDMQQSGIGALYYQLELLKKKLEAQGYFNPAHKKPKPAWIEHIGLVTGKTTAALQDVMKTIRTRWPMMKVTLFDTLVQGSEAPKQIVSALKKADEANLDAILLVRGGGSIEDLFCFNDEEIVKTIYNMKTYVVTGIGHEIDTSLADLAADHKALTPTAAAQWISPDQKEISNWLTTKQQQMESSMRRLFEQNTGKLIYLQANPYLSNPANWARQKALHLEKSQSALLSFFKAYPAAFEKQLTLLEHQLRYEISDYCKANETRLKTMDQSLYMAAPKARILLGAQNLQTLDKQMADRIKSYTDAMNARLLSLEKLLMAGSPQGILDRGYAIVRKDGKALGSIKELALGQTVQVSMKDGDLMAIIEEITNGK